MLVALRPRCVRRSLGTHAWVRARARARAQGEVMHVKNAICLHEEDDGVLWKHQDWRTGAAEIRRGRRLVVSFMASISNYTYGARAPRARSPVPRR